MDKKWEIELEKSKIKGQVLQITEPRTENNKNRNIQKERKQNIPAVSWTPQGHNGSQYQTSYPQRSKPYSKFLNTPQPRFLQEFQPRPRNNQNRFQYNPYNQMIPRMYQLTLNTVPSQTQHTIEFPVENQENPKESGKQNFHKQFEGNESLNQKSRNWNNKIQDNPNWLREGTQLQNAGASENLIQLNCDNYKEPGHFKRECPYLSQNQGN